jgi:CBS domain-containing protein
MQMMRTIRDVMTESPVCCSLQDSVQDVAKMMANEDTGFIPIKENNKLVGVITDRDLVVRAMAHGAVSPKATVEQFATYTPITVKVDQPINEAIALMEEHMIRRLCVVDNGSLCGVVSLGDLAETNPQKAEEVLTEISKSPKTMAHVRARGRNSSQNQSQFGQPFNPLTDWDR